MGAHPDFHITRVLHHWRSRAKEAEDLLAEVANASAEYYTDTDIFYTVPEELLDRIDKHLRKEKR